MGKIAVFMLFLLPAGLFADTITLKDGQQFEAEVLDFDLYYLNVRFVTGKEAALPWQEIKAVSHTTTDKDWREDMYITPDDAEVKTLVVPVSRDRVFEQALFPGFFLRGSGHLRAKDVNMAMSLLSAEIVSLIMMGVSGVELIRPQDGSGASVVSQAVFFTGLGIFTASWLYDLIFAPLAADRYNASNEFLLNDTEKEKKE
ncbi:MAG TPA: hypothetical protein P5511_08985 [Candidatus Goldiibacteriota bacterium]|nr:hypothetical protein [Candidatus Goldiibacteriota bacterium]